MNLKELKQKVTLARESLFYILQCKRHDMDLPVYTELDDLIDELWETQGYLQCMLDYCIKPIAIPCPYCEIRSSQPVGGR